MSSRVLSVAAGPKRSGQQVAADQAAARRVDSPQIHPGPVRARAVRVQPSSGELQALLAHACHCGRTTAELHGPYWRWQRSELQAATLVCC